MSVWKDSSGEDFSKSKYHMGIDKVHCPKCHYSFYFEDCIEYYEAFFNGRWVKMERINPLPDRCPECGEVMNSKSRQEDGIALC